MIHDNDDGPEDPAAGQVTSEVRSYDDYSFIPSETLTRHYADGSMRRWTRTGDGPWRSAIADGDTIVISGSERHDGRYRVLESHSTAYPMTPNTMRCERIHDDPQSNH